jgi:hypothetical protein
MEEIMRIIVGCEFSQIVTMAFRNKGHEAFSCDLLPTEGQHPEWHYQEDIFEVLGRESFDLGIFHPPCTRLCNSGVRWLKERKLWHELEEAGRLFRELLNAPIERIAIENPIPHGYAINIIGRSYDQIIHPWMFGHGETKATCLWLKNLPKLQPTNIVEGREQRIWKMSPGANRGKERSRTFQGIADAMAEQWSELVA